MKIWAEAELKWHTHCWTPTTLRKRAIYLYNGDEPLGSFYLTTARMTLWHTAKQVFTLEKKEPKR